MVRRGTALGLYRDNTFLKGDNDIDIDVYTDIKVYDILKNLPFRIISIVTQMENIKIQFLDDETKVLFDIWFYHQDGNKIKYRDM